jgi:hypothetical protein
VLKFVTRHAYLNDDFALRGIDGRMQMSLQY